MTILFWVLAASLARAQEPAEDPRWSQAVAELKAKAGPGDAEEFSRRMERSAAFARTNGGCAVAGRVSLDGAGDPEAVSAQMLIHQGGWYADYYDPKGRPIGFRAPGYDPIEIRPECPVDGGVAWTDVLLKRTPSDRLGSVTMKLELEQGGDPKSAKVSVYPAFPESNEPHNGVDARRACRKGTHCPSIASPRATMDASGALKSEGLSPMDHGFYITAPGYVSHYSTFPVRPGETTDAGLITLARSRRVSLRYLVTDKLPFKGKPAESSAEGGGQWKAGGAWPNRDLVFDQKSGAIFVSPAFGPADLADLGAGKVEDFAAKTSPDSIDAKAPWRLPLTDGHVYLLRLRNLPRWVLVEARVDR